MLESDSLQRSDSPLVFRSVHRPACPRVVGECVAQDLGRSIKIAGIGKPSGCLHASHDVIACRTNASVSTANGGPSEIIRKVLRRYLAVARST